MGFFAKIFGRQGAQLQTELEDQRGQNSTQLRRSTTSLSSAAAEQTDAVHETLASMTEIRSMLSQTDNQVKRSLLLAETVQYNGIERVKTLDRLQKAMDAIKESNILLSDLQASFKAIHSKARVINDIVSKTQLLSFNASIEAARAGQFGKGFSVVAEEVGRLAKSSGQAAREIEQLLSESQVRATSVVEMMMSRAEEGVAVTREVKQSFNEMSAAITQISQGLTQISDASKEQTIGIERTSVAIERISQTAARSRENASEIMRLTESTREDAPLMDEANINSLLNKLTGDSQSSPEIAHKVLKEVDADDPSFKAQE